MSSNEWQRAAKGTKIAYEETEIWSTPPPLKEIKEEAA